MILDLLSHCLGSAISGFPLNEKMGFISSGFRLHHPGAGRGRRDLMAPVFPLQIHAYNLETNTWEEITTKPHEKVGELGISLLSL